MFPLVMILALPFVLKTAAHYLAGAPHDTLGALPVRKGLSAGAGAGAGFLASPAGQTAAMAALGPGAAVLATPQGKAALSRGVALTRSAKAGNPKAKRRIVATKAKARAGDPKAKRELAVMKTAARLDSASEPEDYEAEDEPADEYDGEE